jgi:hypothetical protein
MKIVFHQSGGYAGLIRGAEVDTEQLPADRRAELERLVRQSGVLDLPSAEVCLTRDSFQYDLTLETDRRVVHVSLSDPDVPPSVAPLLEYLQRIAQPRPPRQAGGHAP